ADGQQCRAAQAGFSAQVECTAELMRAYLDELDQKGQTRAGFQLNRAIRTLDPCSFVPKNRATVAAYTYTPWVGASSLACGRKGMGGSTLLSAIFKRYMQDTNFAPSP